VSSTVYEDEEVGAVERVIQSEEFREELQEMVAQHISESSSQPLYDLISLRQRYGHPDDNHRYGLQLSSCINRSIITAFYLALTHIPREHFTEVI